MNFNSIEFFLFLPLVFGLYWLLSGKTRQQNILLLVASYVFYGWWDWRFLGLILLSSVFDFFIGQTIYNQESKSKSQWLLFLSLGLNLGLLGFFKYYNFFVNSFVEAFATVGISLNFQTLRIILPVGISFYTFQTLSYTLDIYRGRLKPTKDWVSFFTFVAFFPQLVAGPIERAAKMLPQFHKERRFEYSQATEGLKFILYGLFKKIVIADYCAVQVMELFGTYQNQTSLDLFLGMYIFATVYFYCDFSAYSEIALGVAALFGFQLSRNFAYPLFSKSMEIFWQRWHITMSKWFRDYVYMSMARSNPWKKLGRNALLMIMFTLIGLWHGAKWTFIAWGFFNGIAFLLYSNFFKSLKIPFEHTKIWGWASILITNFFVALTLIFLLSRDMASSWGYIKYMLQPDWGQPSKYLSHLFWPIAILVWEWQFRDKWHGLAFDRLKRWQRWGVYLALVFVTIHYYGQESDFIYFQF